VALAQSSKQVILLDCDFRRPTLHHRLALSNQSGLSQLFFEQQPGLNGTLKPGGVDGLDVLTSGPLPPNPAELLGSQRMLALLDELGGRADILVIDTPPALVVADASILAPHVDGVLLVVEPGRTRREVARAAVAQLRRVNARLLGVVINNLDVKRKGYGYRYREYRSTQASQEAYYSAADTEISQK
jgi:capsular exopolysaccharide synthesis family protein